MVGGVKAENKTPKFGHIVGTQEKSFNFQCMSSMNIHLNTMKTTSKIFFIYSCLPEAGLWTLPLPSFTKAGKPGGLWPLHSLISRMCHSSAEKFISITQRSLCCLSWVHRVMVHRHGPFAVISKGIQSQDCGALLIPQLAACRPHGWDPAVARQNTCRGISLPLWYWKLF